MTEQPINIKKIDFSEFHPTKGFHNILQCNGYPGGRKRHLEYYWEFITRPALTAFFFRPLCWMGRHELCTWSRTVGPDHVGPVSSWQVCMRCAYRPTSTNVEDIK